MIYKFTAEHISRNTAIALVLELKARDVKVMHAGMDPAFDNHVLIIVTCEDAVAETIRDRIWELNRGTHCFMSTLTEDELEAYL